MSDKPFVHLHLHTDHSLLDAAIQIKPLAKHLASIGAPACAITDHGNMYGAINFYHTMKANGIKPLIGCEVYITQGSRHDRTNTNAKDGGKVNHHLLLLCKDYEGYQNLVKLTSKAFTEGFYYKPRIDKELLAQHSRGLIGTSACLSGIPAAYLLRDKWTEAVAAVEEFKQIFGADNYFVEIQDHGLDAQARIRESLIRLSRETRTPIVATNDAHYLTPEDYKAHDLLLCIGSGKTVGDPNRLRYGSDKFYVRSPEEMWELFADIPEALHRTQEIAERCNLELPSGVNHVPVYPIPASDADLTIDEYFEKIVRQGYEHRRRTVWDAMVERDELRYSLATYQERVSQELAMIKRMGFPSYFLIVWDIVRYARQNDIPVGPGRGSAAGSLVAYCLEITDVDPIQYDLLFERFLNPDRVTMPDIDIDFCVRGRASVIDHVAKLYGRDSVCQIITFGTMASKAAIKDVGRALNMPYTDVERIAKMIPPPVRGRNVSISQALEQVPELKEACDKETHTKELIDLAKRLEGCARHSSVHAAGVVIAPRPLDELVPVSVSSKSELTTQYVMNDLEKTGMLKMDFLALTTLTVINDCLKTLKHGLSKSINWSEIPLDDAPAMELFAAGQTDAIFQFESSGMQEICRRLKPKTLEDLAALNALYRPGPLDGGMVDDFIQRHHGVKKVSYLAPQMKEILANTHGIIVYQEQIMQIAQKLAGYTLAEADLMRRAMGKKKREEMAKHEQKFVDGAVERNIKREKAAQIFSLMAQFADYGFNRSHSVAYAYLAFQTAYLKAHYPAHFYAAVLTNELDDTAKVFKYAKELRSHKISLLPPDINESYMGFTPVGDSVRYGLAAIKGIGGASVETIIGERQANGRFKSVYEFAERVEEKAVNKRVFEGLIWSGAFDSLKTPECRTHAWRASLAHQVDGFVSHGQRVRRSAASGQNSLFGAVTDEQTAVAHTVAITHDWTHTELLTAEKTAVGFYISGHPLENYAEIIKAVKCCESLQFTDVAPDTILTFAGIATGVNVRLTKKGEKFALLQLEDQTCQLKCVLWSNVYKRFAHVCTEGAALLVTGRCDESSEATLIVDSVEPLEEALIRRARTVSVTLPALSEADVCEGLFKILSEHEGNCEVVFRVALEDDVVVSVKPNQKMYVAGNAALDGKLRGYGCVTNWRMEHPNGR